MAMMPDKVKSEAAKVALFKLIGKRGTIHRSEELGNAPRPDVRTSDIVFTQVAFAYPSRADATIFDSLQLTLAAGKQTALVGATGCGKSTIVALLQRFYDPSAGSLMVGDVDIRTLPVSWWRSQIGLVSQVSCYTPTGSCCPSHATWFRGC
jgi:ATP-binding cassette subfamily B (MDR/TAP) protein 1